MKNEIAVQSNIENKIIVLRGVQVMIDRDIAAIYGVETKRLNEQVKRNIERFPEEFMFQLTRDEVDSVKSQFATSRNNMFEGQDGGTRKLPYAFTEHGVTMLASVLKSETAVKASVQIVRAFVSMRHFWQSNAEIFAELKFMRQHQFETDVHLRESDKKIDQLFSLMDKYNIDETQGIFFQGQIFDAYAKFESFIQSAKKEIILIDGYVDLSVLERLSKKNNGVTVTIYTDPKTKLTAQDIQKFNAQYPTLTLRHTTKMHDRFMIIDGTVLYHIGASLKDLGKKCFAFEVLAPTIIPAILQNI